MKRTDLQELRVRCRCGKLRPAEDPVCPDCYHRRRKNGDPDRPAGERPPRR